MIQRMIAQSRSVSKVSRIPKEFLPECNNFKNEGRDSTMGDLVTIWADGASIPAIVRLIRGKTELLRGMDIIKKLDITSNFGGNQRNADQSEWEMMTFNAKYHCVFSLVPTSCAYTKLNEYFGKLRGSKIESLQVQGDYG